VIVTLEGNGTGVSGITETSGRGSVVVSVPFLNSTCHEPFVLAMLNGVTLMQELRFITSGAQGENGVTNGVPAPAGVKIPAIDVPKEPPIMFAPNWKLSPGGTATSLSEFNSRSIWIVAVLTLIGFARLLRVTMHTESATKIHDAILFFMEFPWL
jgi:hypothetical protein